MKTTTSKAITVNKEAFFYLVDMERCMNGQEPLTEWQRCFQWEKSGAVNGRKKITRHSFRWSIDEVCEILTTHGYEYTIEKDAEIASAPL